MGVKKVEKCDPINSLSWTEIIKLISSGDSARNPIVGRASTSHGSSAPINTSEMKASCSSSKPKNNKTCKKRRVIKQKPKEGGYKSKIKEFLTPCKSYPSNRYVDRRLNELERKVNNIEKLYCNAIVNWAKESKEKTKKIKRDEKIIEYYLHHKGKKNIKTFQKPNTENRVEMEGKSTNRKDTINLSKKQHIKKAVVFPERRSPKNVYTVNQIRDLSPSEVETELNAKSNIIITDDETGKYYFVTSTTGYVKQFDDEEEIPSAHYEAAASVAKFTKKNLLYLFNEEILPKRIGSSQKKYNNYNSNETNIKKSIKKYVNDKSTHTERVLNDKGINTKETYYYQVEEDSLPSSYLPDAVINTNTDIFESPSPDDTNDGVNKFKIPNAAMNREDICFSAYPLSSSCTSFSETSDNYIKLKMEMKKMKN